MKKPSRSWAAISLIPPLVILCTMVLGSLPGSQNRSYAKFKATTANLEIGITAKITGASSADFQNVFLNLVAVRINPKPNSKNTNAPNQTDKKWFTIGVPTGSATPTSAKPGDVQIDMIAAQSQLQLFNIVGISPNTYHTLELVLDAVTPGTIVPICGTGIEGCINYPIQLQNRTTQLSITIPDGITTTKGTTLLLPIEITLDVGGKPTAPGAPYPITATVTAPVDASQRVGTVSGVITGPDGKKKKPKGLSIVVEETGSNVVVASAKPTATKGKVSAYTVIVPAPSNPGANFDLYVTGGSGEYQAIKNFNLVGGVAAAQPTLTPKGGLSLGTISGQVTDMCTQNPITGATIQILIPPITNPTADCETTPADCVSVATATTDNNGFYPIPGTILAPAAFNNVPIGNPAIPYTLEVTASGYDTELKTANASTGAKGGKCPAGEPSTGNCSFALTTGYIQGQVNLVAAPGSGNFTTVQVFAERSHTNNLVSTLSSPIFIRGSQQKGNFSLNVPVKGGDLDLFASALDLFEGATDPYPGHTILVQSAVQAPSACATAAPVGLFSGTMNCTGHGTLTGTIASADSATTAQLYKGDVALIEAAPRPTTGNPYSMCLPPDESYEIQKREQGASAGPTIAVGPMALPSATSTPCPSTCFSDGDPKTCPGICAKTTGPTL